MVVRPSDWFLVGFVVDPTPGDAFGIRGLAQKYADIAAIAGEASSGVRNARSSGSASAWVGDAAEVFRDRSSRMPGELLKANDSYQMVADALKTWAESVDDTQAQADRGLQQAREAHQDLASAQAALGSAELSWLTVEAQQLTFQKLVKLYTDVPVPANVKMPTDYQLRSANRNAQQAQTSIASAQRAIASADARLAAARALVVAAKQTRDDAERRAVHQISEAKGHAVKPSSIWEAIQDSAAWQAVVVIATVVLTIVTIVAIFVGGPLVWALIIAATVLLMVNALMSIAQGKDAWGELIMLGIGLIPGGRLLGLAAKGVDLLARAGAVGARVAGAINRVGGGVRAGLGALTRVAKPLTDAMGRLGDRATWVVRSAVHRLGGGEFTDEGNMIVRKWTVIGDQGPLGAADAFPADTFRSSTYTEVLVSNPHSELFRTTVPSPGSDGLGGFWSHTPPSGPQASQFDFALKPEWNVTNSGAVAGVHTALPQATHVISMHPPLGTRIFEGPAGPQISTGVGTMVHGNVTNIFAGRLEGGAQQVYLQPDVVANIRGAVSGGRLTVTPMEPVINTRLPGAR